MTQNKHAILRLLLHYHYCCFKKKNGNKFMNFSLEFARENMTIIVLNKIHECFALII